MSRVSYSRLLRTQVSVTFSRLSVDHRDILNAVNTRVLIIIYSLII
jgi:hypothetical protein